MSIELSSGLSQQRIQALADAFSGGAIRIFAGTRPDSPDDAEAGTLLGIVTVDGLPDTGLHFVAAGDALTKANEAWVFQALASDVATWFRVVAPDDTGTASLTQRRIDGDIGTTEAPGDMTWETIQVKKGVHYTLDSFVYFINPIGDLT